MGGEWLSIHDVAEEIGMSATWVRKEIDTGRLPCQRIKNEHRDTIRIHRIDLEDFVERYVTYTGGAR